MRVMKKSFKLENLGCANCAARMEEDIKKLPGVTNARIAFMTCKLTLETEGSDIAGLIDPIQKIISSYEDDCRIVVK